MFKLKFFGKKPTVKRKKTTIKTLLEKQRNLSGKIIYPGEKVKVRRSKEDPRLVDVISVKRPKRIVKNAPLSCVDPNVLP